jgi:hypothetical protein
VVGYGSVGTATQGRDSTVVGGATGTVTFASGSATATVAVVPTADTSVGAKLGTGADFAVVDQRMVCRVRGIRFRHRFGYCTLIACSGSFLAVKTDGEVVLFRDGGEGPEILARARPLPGTLRALPALAGGRFSLRDDRTLVALDVGPAPAARP